MSHALSVVSWNVNSLRARLDAVIRWLREHRPEIVCVQETKVPDELFPREPFEELGYQIAVHGQKTYNGVAILSRLPMEEVSRGFDGAGSDEQKRLIAATIGGIRVINAYVPNGSEVGSEKFTYKLAFLEDLRRYFAEKHNPRERLALVGDFNVATEPRDVFSLEEMNGQVCFHPDERAALARLSAWGFQDQFRRFEEGGGHYTWWDYRQASFRRNRGLRIDHIWATPSLADTARSCWIDREERARERASDHAPVTATFEI